MGLSFFVCNFFFADDVSRDFSHIFLLMRWKSFPSQWFNVNWNDTRFLISISMTFPLAIWSFDANHKMNSTKINKIHEHYDRTKMNFQHENLHLRHQFRRKKKVSILLPIIYNKDIQFLSHLAITLDTTVVCSSTAATCCCCCVMRWKGKRKT